MDAAVSFAATVYVPAQVSLRNGTIRFVSSQRLQRQSEEEKLSLPERTCP